MIAGQEVAVIIKIDTFTSDFMRRRNHIGSIMRMLVVFFLLSSIVCSTINSMDSGIRSHVTILVKKPVSSSKSGIQLPEKIESENDHKPHINFFFIHPVCEFLRIDIGNYLATTFYNSFRFRGNIAGTPLYIVKRSIMI